jgi:hypothetical protein
LYRYNEVAGYANKMEGADGKKHRQEDLPIRLAFEHLSSLAGMSQKVGALYKLSECS